jgi:hypothetical protein
VKHYSLAEWTDFVRDLTNESQRSEMKRHLESSCPACSRVVTLLGAVWECRAPVEVPDDLTARARSIFPRRRPAPAAESLAERLVAALKFDSFAAAAPQGARAVPASVRRLRFGTASVDVELVVDAPRGRAVSLTGLSSANGGEVHLFERQKLVQTVAASPFGEFHLQFDQRKGMRLLITGAPGSASIEVPLDFLQPLKQKSLKLNPKDLPGSSEEL